MTSATELLNEALMHMEAFNLPPDYFKIQELVFEAAKLHEVQNLVFEAVNLLEMHNVDAESEEALELSDMEQHSTFNHSQLGLK